MTLAVVYVPLRVHADNPPNGLVSLYDWTHPNGYSLNALARKDLALAAMGTRR